MPISKPAKTMTDREMLAYLAESNSDLLKRVAALEERVAVHPERTPAGEAPKIGKP